MNTAIVFYTYTGNTKKAAMMLEDFFRAQGDHVELIELQPLDESGTFLGQCMRGLQHMKAQLAPVPLDLSAYDKVIFGTPVWAFGPAPAMNTYLEKCTGIAGKQAIIFITYGSGSGIVRCLNYMEAVLQKKGVVAIKQFHIQQGKVATREHIFPRLEILLGL